MTSFSVCGLSRRMNAGEIVSSRANWLSSMPRRVYWSVRKHSPGVESNVRVAGARGAERSVVVLLVSPFRGRANIH